MLLKKELPAPADRALEAIFTWIMGCPLECTPFPDYRLPALTDTTDDTAKIQEPRLWTGDGWTARVIKNEEDDGWAVAMVKDGEPEPALVGPWTMGRDKKNPKPLDITAFHTLVKTANEFVRRHEQQLHATLHQSITVTADAGRITVHLDIVPDEEGATATLRAQDELGEELARASAPPTFKLTPASAAAWAEGGFQRVR